MQAQPWTGVVQNHMCHTAALELCMHDAPFMAQALCMIHALHAWDLRACKILTRWEDGKGKCVLRLRLLAQHCPHMRRRCHGCPWTVLLPST